jgi:hypothetical protein
MSYTPTSPPGIALAQLRRMVSLSTTFQTAFSAASPAAALAFILLGRQPLTNLASGGAIAYLSESPFNWELNAGGDHLYLENRGRIILQFIYLPSSSDSIEDRYMKGVDFVGNTAKDVRDLSGVADESSAFTSNHLDITNIVAEYAAPGDVRYDASRGLFFSAKLAIDWGIV